MRRLLQKVQAMLFGTNPGDDSKVITPATHAADMRESSKRRHDLVGEQSELERRLYFLALEARADAGAYGHGQDHPAHSR